MEREHNGIQVWIANGPTAECDGSLVTAAKSGDQQAYAELCRRHSSRVFRTVFRITRNAEDAEDALQESLMKAFVHLGSFNERSAFSSWLTRIAINCAFMQLRKRRNDTESGLNLFDGSDNEDQRVFVEPSPNPEDVCVEKELARTVRHAVGRLPPSLRGAISVRYYQDASLEEIAKALGITEGATKARLYRGRAALRRTLGSTRTGAFRQPGRSGKRKKSGKNSFVEQ